MLRVSPGARYLCLIIALLLLVWWQPVLWEVALVGILAGAAWWLTRPAGDAETVAESDPATAPVAVEQAPAQTAVPASQPQSSQNRSSGQQ